MYIYESSQLQLVCNLISTRLVSFPNRSRTIPEWVINIYLWACDYQQRWYGTSFVSKRFEFIVHSSKYSNTILLIQVMNCLLDSDLLKFSFPPRVAHVWWCQEFLCRSLDKRYSITDGKVIIAICFLQCLYVESCWPVLLQSSQFLHRYPRFFSVDLYLM